MTEHRVADKRALECDDNGYDGGPENDPKKPKSLPSSSPMAPHDSLGVKDSRKWKLLPAVVYELLALIKKSEKPDPDDCSDVQQKKIMGNIKEEIKVLSNPNCQDKILDIEITNNNQEKISLDNVKVLDEKSNTNLLNSKELNKLLTDESSVQNQEELLNLPAEKTAIVEVSKETTFNTKTTHTNIENVPKKDQEIFEANEKTNISITPTLVEGDSNHSIGYKSSKIENMIILSKNQQLLNLLKNCCLNGTSKIPTSKPNPCICKYCMLVANMPKDQLAVNNLFTSTNYSSSPSSNPNCKLVPFNMYVSHISVSDCSICATNNCCCFNNSNSKYYLEKKTAEEETSKNVWVNDLISLIRKNSESGSNGSTFLKCVKNKICNVVEQINSKGQTCDVCKISKNPNSRSDCKCSHTHHTKKRKV